MFTEKDIERAEKMNAEVWVEIDEQVKNYRKDNDSSIFITARQHIEQEMIIAQNHINEFFFKKLAQLENQIEELRGGK